MVVSGSPIPADESPTGELTAPPVQEIQDLARANGGEVKGIRSLNLKEAETVQQAIQLAVGAASMTWESVHGVFNSEWALDICTQLEHDLIRRFRAGEILMDPTHGRIDKDIQDQVDEMDPESLGQRVAIENTLQDRRDAETKYQVGEVAPDED